MPPQKRIRAFAAAFFGIHFLNPFPWRNPSKVPLSLQTCCKSQTEWLPRTTMGGGSRVSRRDGPIKSVHISLEVLQKSKFTLPRYLRVTQKCDSHGAWE